MLGATRQKGGSMTKKENVVKFEPKEKSDKQINKIKLEKKTGAVSVGFEKNTDSGKKETTFTGFQEARKEFKETFQKLKGVMFDILPCLNDDYQDKTVITGYSISYKGKDLMGIVMTAQIELPSQNCPLNINTPFVKFQSYCEANGIDDETQINRTHQKVLSEIFEYTERYIKGESAKQQLPLIKEG